MMPTVPLCRAPDGVGACPFSSLCPPRRQEIAQSGPVRGMDCYWYQSNAVKHSGLLRPPSEAAVERAALEAEGNA
jgi:hypothetical protein